MRNITELAEATPEEVAQLRSAGIGTIAQLWARVGEDKGIEQVANAAHMQPDRLAELLAHQAVREAGGEGSSWLRRHWLDVTLMIGAVLLIELLLRILIAVERLPPRLGLYNLLLFVLV